MLPLIGRKRKTYSQKSKFLATATGTLSWPHHHLLLLVLINNWFPKTIATDNFGTKERSTMYNGYGGVSLIFGISILCNQVLRQTSGSSKNAIFTLPHLCLFAKYVNDENVDSSYTVIVCKNFRMNLLKDVHTFVPSSVIIDTLHER